MHIHCWGPLLDHVIKAKMAFPRPTQAPMRAIMKQWTRMKSSAASSSPGWARTRSSTEPRWTASSWATQPCTKASTASTFRPTASSSNSKRLGWSRTIDRWSLLADTRRSNGGRSLSWYDQVQLDRRTLWSFWSLLPITDNILPVLVRNLIRRVIFCSFCDLSVIKAIKLLLWLTLDFALKRP